MAASPLYQEIKNPQFLDSKYYPELKYDQQACCMGSFNQLSEYDVLTHHALLCTVVGMMSVHVMHVSNYTVEIMTAMQICMLCLLDLTVTSECDRRVLIT
jgi:hypothetical protein